MLILHKNANHELFFCVSSDETRDEHFEEKVASKMYAYIARVFYHRRSTCQKLRRKINALDKYSFKVFINKINDYFIEL